MFACRSRSALVRAKAAREILPYSVLFRTKFSTITPLRQAAAVENAQFDSTPGTRLPLALQAVYYKPFRRPPTFGLPVCDLQLRSYSVRNLEFMCDFALRAAYYCHLPAGGPIPLPKKTERWTVPKGHFVHKKSQENFERVTHKRLIQIKDGNPETVELWLAFLRKHQYYGVGMKANLFGFDELGVGKRMNVSLETLKDVPRPRWVHFGSRRNFETAMKAKEILESDEYKSLSAEPDKGLEGILDEEVRAAAQKILESPEYKALVEEAAPAEDAAPVLTENIMAEKEQVQAEKVEKALTRAPEVGEALAAVEAVKPPEVPVESSPEISNAETFSPTPVELPKATPESETLQAETPAAPTESTSEPGLPQAAAETSSEETIPKLETIQAPELAEIPPTPTKTEATQATTSLATLAKFTPEPETAQVEASTITSAEVTSELETAQDKTPAEATQAQPAAPAEKTAENANDTSTIEKIITEEKMQSEILEKAKEDGTQPQIDVNAKGDTPKEGW